MRRGAMRRPQRGLSAREEPQSGVDMDRADPIVGRPYLRFVLSRSKFGSSVLRLKLLNRPFDRDFGSRGLGQISLVIPHADRSGE